MKNWFLFGVLLLGGACKKEEAAPPPAGVSIRVRNASGYVFDSVYVNTSGGEGYYGLLGAGRTSGYKTYDWAYSYAYVRVIIHGQEVTWRPIDYVGETPLANGRYTYVLGVDNVAARRISFRLEKP